MHRKKQREMMKSGKVTGPAKLSDTKAEEASASGSKKASANSTANSNRKRTWVFAESTTSHALVACHDISTPQGWIAGNFNLVDDKKKIDHAAQEELVKKSAMQVATAPGKQLLMTCFMLWMSGSSLQIFSIMMLCMGLFQPMQKIVNVNKEFSRYADTKVDLTMAKLTFVALNILGVCIALYKCQTLGLLPTGTTDWISTANVRPAVEFASGGALGGALFAGR